MSFLYYLFHTQDYEQSEQLLAVHIRAQCGTSYGSIVKVKMRLFDALAVVALRIRQTEEALFEKWTGRQSAFE